MIEEMSDYELFIETVSGRVRINEIPEDRVTESMCLAVVGEYGGRIRELKYKQTSEESLYSATAGIYSGIGELNKQINSDICVNSITTSPLSIVCIPESELTHEMCVLAVTIDYYAMSHIPDKFKTKEFYDEIAQYGVIKGLPESMLTYELCLKAVFIKGDNLKYVPDKFRTHELCLVAVMNGCYAHLLNENDYTLDICIAIVNIGVYGGIFEIPDVFFSNKTFITALMTSKSTQISTFPIRKIPKELRTYDILFLIIDKYPDLINDLDEDELTEEVCLIAVKSDGFALSSIIDSKRTNKVCLEAVKNKGVAVRYLTKSQRTPDICLAAVLQDKKAYYYLTESQRSPEMKSYFEKNPR